MYGWGYPSYGYGCGSCGGNSFWIIIVVLIIFFIFFCNGNNRGFGGCNCGCNNL